MNTDGEEQKSFRSLEENLKKYKLLSSKVSKVIKASSQLKKWKISKRSRVQKHTNPITSIFIKNHFKDFNLCVESKHTSLVSSDLSVNLTELEKNNDSSKLNQTISSEFDRDPLVLCLERLVSNDSVIDTSPKIIQESKNSFDDISKDRILAIQSSPSSNIKYQLDVSDLVSQPTEISLDFAAIQLSEFIDEK